MPTEVFNRHEKKYAVTAEQYDHILGVIEEFMEPDLYNRDHETYPISNIYYDTEDDYLVRTAAAKPTYREKLRLRAYGLPHAESMVYVEVKKKVCGFGNKRRSLLHLSDAYEFLSTGQITRARPEYNEQVLREIQYILERHTLRPKLYLSYDRRAYFSSNDHDLRISFDKNILTRYEDLHLESGAYGDALLSDDIRIMEIKTAGSIPVRLGKTLSELAVFPIRFSKYSTAYVAQTSYKGENIYA